MIDEEFTELSIRIEDNGTVTIIIENLEGQALLNLKPHEVDVFALKLQQASVKVKEDRAEQIEAHC